jgi:hypothetical protein
MPDMLDLWFWRVDSLWWGSIVTCVYEVGKSDTLAADLYISMGHLALDPRGRHWLPQTNDARENWCISVPILVGASHAHASQIGSIRSQPSC